MQRQFERKSGELKTQLAIFEQSERTHTEVQN